MSFRHTRLSQLCARDRCFLSEGGLETILIFEKNIKLEHFAAFVLLETSEGRQVLRDYYLRYIKIAQKFQTGLVLQTPTWRASATWLEVLDYANPEESVRVINRDAVDFLKSIRSECSQESSPVVISGSLGFTLDSYKESTADESEKLRAACRAQIQALAASNVDMVSLMTATSASQAIEVIEMAREVGLPIMVSFSLELNGTLINGATLSDTILCIDKATQNYALYFGINCAHPEHFLRTLRAMTIPALSRIGSIRANASTKSHAELDECSTLDPGDNSQLADYYKELSDIMPGLLVVGGCCGTSEQHINAIAAAVLGVRCTQNNVEET